MLGALRWPDHGARMVGEEVTSGAASHTSLLGDEALVLAIARGDRLAMAALYDRYAALLLAVATRIVGNRVQAEDLLHDVLLEAWHRAGEYDPERGTVRAWLVTRVRSRALDDRIGSARRAELVRSKLPSLDETAHAYCDDCAADGDHVRREVACLPRDLEMVIDLAYFEGLSAVEIGVRLKIPAGTVKSRLARAMALLRRHFMGQPRGATCSFAEPRA
jgi:RNA polymerase sigma-70 factor, ECF subfamily